jgi:sigma-B regulation protein RsbU (phosphoserine phosphatase)
MLMLILIYMVIRQRSSRQLLIRQKREYEESLRSHDLKIASEIQSTLLLDAVPKDLVGLDVARTSIPATEVGGDFLAFWFQGGCFDVLVGDVMGKGIPGALLAAALKIRFTNARISEYTIAEGETLPSLNTILRHSHETITPILMNFERFATLNYLRIDIDAGRAEWINCGHTELIHCRAKGLGVSHIPGINMPLGFTKDCEFTKQKAPISSGDVLVLYSDGISEAINANSKLYGVERLMTLVQRHRDTSATEILATILCDVENFAGEHAKRDDLTCAVICVQ